MYRSLFKRFIDIVFSFLTAVFFAPIYIIVALIIYLQDFDNPIFKQKRIGLNQKEFTIFKFRSMPINTANVPSSSSDKITITPFGKFIRRTNLDELPQLFNIFIGDMSIIGPRPSLVSQTDLIQLRRKYNVYTCKPGLTGLAQVNGFDNLPNATKAKWDGEYANDISFIKDTIIVLRTLAYLTKKPPTY